MHVEREIAGIALPFIIGIAISVYTGILRCNAFSTAIASLILCILLIILLLSDRALIRNSTVCWSVLICMMTLCGIHIGSSDIILSISNLHNSHPIGDFALRFGGRLQEAIMRIPFSKPETCSIINALITGEKSGIPTDVKEAFHSSGASHILALSGLHLGIIYAIIRKPLALIGNTPLAKVIKSVITICICCFYTLATGAGPSIVRALLFIIISETALLTHRKSSLISTLMTAMVIQLVIDSSSIQEVGFQLSYAAVAGIALIYPRLSSFWPGNGFDDNIMTKGMRWIWNSSALSISCQLTTGPLAYFYFGSFPLHFILTNLIALPLTGLIIPAALITLLTSELGCCPEILIRATDMLVSALSAALNVISTM